MSNSRLVRDRFQERQSVRRAVAGIYVLSMLAYLCWRVTILNHDALTLSLVYLTAETFGFVLGLTLIFSSWNYRHREPPPAPVGLDVEVFVTTFREPLEIVRHTLLAARDIAYPHRTLLLDDGRRPEMRALAAELGVRYLARDNNMHAKAGNLNFGLSNSTADFVMVLDADHIASRNALEMMLGFFGDPKVAMVQCPQDYYNVDAFQFLNVRRNGLLWHDQSFFYQIAQACRDWFGGASCVGTSVVYRRAALDRIGGIPTETVTEDIHTSLKLHKAGFEAIYLNESVAYGIAAADIRDYYKTRHRWAHGNIRALCHERILSCAGLSLGQRLSYLTLGIIYLEGWQQAMLFVVPWMSLLLGWAPFEITFLNVLIVLLFPIFSALLLQELGCGLSRFWVNEIFSVARFPVHIAASLALFSNKSRFRTSVKNIRGTLDWKLLTPQIIVGAVSLIALAVGVGRFISDPIVGPLAHAFMNLWSGRVGDIDWNEKLTQGYALELVVVAGFWAVFNAAKCLYVVRKALVNARESHSDYRFDIRLPAEVRLNGRSELAQIDRISLSWIRLSIYQGNAPQLGEKLRGQIYLPSGVLPFEAIVIRRSAPRVQHITVGSLEIELSAGSRPAIECELVWTGAVLRARLEAQLYSVGWHRAYMHKHAFFMTPLEAVGRLLRGRHPFETHYAAWAPALCRNAGQAEASFIAVNMAGDEAGFDLLTFQPFEPGTLLDLEILTAKGIMTRLLRVEGVAPEGAKGISPANFTIYRARALKGEPSRELALTALAAE